MDVLQLNSKIYFGNDPLNRLRELDFKKIFIVTDPYMVKSGGVEHVINHLPSGAEYLVYSDVTPDPSINTVTRGAVEMVKFGADCVIALGGGSAIDVSKAMAFVEKQVSNKPEICYLIAIPTTSGTGSEATAFAVIKDRKKGIKYPLVNDELLPKEAILDVRFVETVPPNVTADTGMDVLTHAIESYVSTVHSLCYEAFAEKAIRLTCSNLYHAYENPTNKQARTAMHVASCLAGVAFNHTSLGITHSIAHQIGTTFKVSHGRSNAIMLPFVIEFNAANSKEAFDRYYQIAVMQGIAASASDPAMAVALLIEEIRKLMRKMNMPMSLSECGVSWESFKEHLPTLCENAVNDACTATNPVPVTVANIEQILLKAF